MSSALALTVVLGACGGDDDESGVDGNKTLDQLSAAETMEFCEWTVGLIPVEHIVRLSCYLSAIITSDPDQCEALAQDCIDSAGPGDEIDQDVLGCPLRADLPDCASEISVAELEPCMEAVFAQVAGIAAAISCGSQPDELFDLDTPPSCRDVDQQCPGLFNAGDSGATARNLALLPGGGTRQSAR